MTLGKKINLSLFIFILASILLILAIDFYYTSVDNISKELKRNQNEKKEKIELLKEIESKKQISIAYDSYKNWEKLLLNYEYDISNEIKDIPKLKIEKFPVDLIEIKDVNKKKKIFFSIILIGAYHANQEILLERKKLIDITERYNKLNSLKEEEKKWLLEKKNSYNLDTKDNKSLLDELKYRIDIIPISLVLAQAACESGWGTSRFTQTANNIFGEWTFNDKVEGIVPKDRPANASYKIRKFPTITDSIKSYINNLNSSYAYQSLREKRFSLREKNKILNSLSLAEGLLRYSQEREKYVEKIKNIIKYNNLQKLDVLIK